MTSWDLFDVFQLFLPALSLVPTAQTWAAFSDVTNSVRGGSTYYTVVTAAAGARGAMALKLGDGAGATLPTTMSPRYWVVRLN